MSDEYKSAYELAMERLREKDGGSSQRSLRDDQKQRIAEIRKEYQARRAEHELTLKSAVDKAVERSDMEKLQKLDEDDRRERARLDEQEEAAVQRIRDEA
ncbi:MAG: hypothetical protein U0V87_06140 [Acidobacteriota bacterium]